MRFGLVSYKSKNGDTAYNMAQIERALNETAGKVDMLCFAEAFLQGFDSLKFDYVTDKPLAVSQDSETMDALKRLTIEYGTALLFGYIELNGETFYSSCALISGGALVHNYRRISAGWKLPGADGHYMEGDDTEGFDFFGEHITIALCGDLWDSPERFATDGLLIWPVYLNYSPEEWEAGVFSEYAEHAGSVAPRVLMINPLDDDPKAYGGSFAFVRGRAAAGTRLGEESILIVDTDELR